MKKNQTIARVKREKPLYSHLFVNERLPKTARGRKIAVTPKSAGE
jgi:hypothetical protein